METFVEEEGDVYADLGIEGPDDSGGEEADSEEAPPSHFGWEKTEDPTTWEQLLSRDLFVVGDPVSGVLVAPLRELLADPAYTNRVRPAGVPEVNFSFLEDVQKTAERNFLDTGFPHLPESLVNNPVIGQRDGLVMLLAETHHGTPQNRGSSTDRDAAYPIILLSDLLGRIEARAYTTALRVCGHIALALQPAAILQEALRGLRHASEDALRVLQAGRSRQGMDVAEKARTLEEALRARHASKKRILSDDSLLLETRSFLAAVLPTRRGLPILTELGQSLYASKPARSGDRRSAPGESVRGLYPFPHAPLTAKELREMEKPDVPVQPWLRRLRREYAYVITHEILPKVRMLPELRIRPAPKTRREYLANKPESWVEESLRGHIRWEGRKGDWSEVLKGLEHTRVCAIAALANPSLPHDPELLLKLWPAVFNPEHSRGIWGGVKRRLDMTTIMRDYGVPHIGGTADQEKEHISLVNARKWNQLFRALVTGEDYHFSGAAYGLDSNTFLRGVARQGASLHPTRTPRVPKEGPSVSNRAAKTRRSRSPSPSPRRSAPPQSRAHKRGRSPTQRSRSPPARRDLRRSPAQNREGDSARGQAPVGEHVRGPPTTPVAAPKRLTRVVRDEEPAPPASTKSGQLRVTYDAATAEHAPESGEEETMEIPPLRTIVNYAEPPTTAAQPQEAGSAEPDLQTRLAQLEALVRTGLLKQAEKKGEKRKRAVRTPTPPTSADEAEQAPPAHRQIGAEDDEEASDATTGSSEPSEGEAFPPHGPPRLQLRPSTQFLTELALGRTAHFTSDTTISTLLKKKWRAPETLLRTAAKDVPGSESAKESFWILPFKELPAQKLEECFNKAMGVVAHTKLTAKINTPELQAQVLASKGLSAHELEFLRTGLPAEIAAREAELWREVMRMELAGELHMRVAIAAAWEKHVKKELDPATWEKLRLSFVKKNTDAKESRDPADCLAQTKALSTQALDAAGDSLALSMEKLKQPLRRAHLLAARVAGVQPLTADPQPTRSSLEIFPDACVAAMERNKHIMAALPYQGTLSRKRGGAQGWEAKRRKPRHIEGRGRQRPTPQHDRGRKSAKPAPNSRAQKPSSGSQNRQPATRPVPDQLAQPRQVVRERKRVVKKHKKGD
jgi:hypothetical protein